MPDVHSSEEAANSSDARGPRGQRLDTRLEAEGAEFLVLGNLLVDRIPAYKTYTNMPGYDLVATNPEKNTSAKIQVKSRWRTNAPGFPIKNFGCDFVVFCRLNRGSKASSRGLRDPEYYVFPVAVVRGIWNRESKWGKVMVRHIDAWEQYQNRWDLIRDFLELDPSRAVEAPAGRPSLRTEDVLTHVGDRPSSIAIAAFRREAERLVGTRLETGKNRRGFIVHTSEKGLTFTPESTGKPRATSWKRVSRVLERYNEIGSLRLVDYHDVTRNSSYLLVILRRLADS